MVYVVTEYGFVKGVFEDESEAEEAVENRPGDVVKTEYFDSASKYREENERH